MPLDLTEKQKMGLELLQDPDKQYILFTGGSRSGKTYLIMEFLVGRALASREFEKSQPLCFQILCLLHSSRT